MLSNAIMEEPMIIDDCFLKSLRKKPFVVGSTPIFQKGHNNFQTRYMSISCSLYPRITENDVQMLPCVIARENEIAEL